jgi:hypothetical protein
MLSRTRIHEDGTTEMYYPSKDKYDCFVLAIKKTDFPLNRKPNQVIASTEEKAVALFRQGGYSMRMVGERTGQKNIISSDKIDGWK